MHLLTRDLWTNDNSLLFGDVSVIKARKLHQTRRNSCSFDALADRDFAETNHSDSETEGPRICDQRQKSWDKSALLAFLRTLHMRILLHVLNLALHFPAVSSDSQHCIDKEGEK